MLVKLHKNQEGRTVAAVCDTDLKGKKFEEGGCQLDMTSGFYAGVEMDDIHAGDVMRNCDSVNIVGSKSVECGIKEGIIDRSSIKKIAGIPYAQAIVSHE